MDAPQPPQIFYRFLVGVALFVRIGLIYWGNLHPNGDVSPNPRKFRRRSNDRRRRAGDRLSRKRCLVISARRHQSPASAWVATADFPEKALCRENSSALEGRRNFLGFGLTSPKRAGGGGDGAVSLMPNPPPLPRSANKRTVTVAVTHPRGP
jgi:hypothetical protein